MREIKFRAWHDGKMIEWSLTAHYRDQHLMQYTGLKDKNGREIYEGDVIEITSFDGETGKEDTYSALVEWDYHSAGFIATNKWMVAIVFESAEVIGNIYENPELVE